MSNAIGMLIGVCLGVVIVAGIYKTLGEAPQPRPQPPVEYQIYHHSQFSVGVIVRRDLHGIEFIDEEGWTRVWEAPYRLRRIGKDKR